MMHLKIEREIGDNLVCDTLRTAEKAASLIDALTIVRENIGTSWYIYTGGHHIAIHRETWQTYKGPRLAIITDS